MHVSFSHMNQQSMFHRYKSIIITNINVIIFELRYINTFNLSNNHYQRHSEGTCNSNPYEIIKYKYLTDLHNREVVGILKV